MRRIIPVALVLAILTGCVSRIHNDDALPAEPGGTLVVGHIITVLTGPSSRWYPPELRFFEIMHRATGARTKVLVESDDAWFAVPVQPGDYELVRLDVAEGPFQGMAATNLTFTVDPGTVTYVGTWRLGVSTPTYQRMMLLSAVAESESELRNTSVAVSFQDRAIITTLPNPVTTETRLYEVRPYPAVNWFRRHQTS
jgi:hypothetical protein